jgi:hypothetical protein
MPIAASVSPEQLAGSIRKIKTRPSKGAKAIEKRNIPNL